MATRRSKVDKKRETGRFVALPVVVLTSPGWASASHTARSLLLHIALQYTGKNNGKLVASAAALQPLGWRSHDTITRAVRDLVACGLLVETRKGRRPNLAAWFALSWFDLDQRTGLDIDWRAYRRGGYLVEPERGSKNAALVPSPGLSGVRTAPAHGIEGPPPIPAHGIV